MMRFVLPSLLLLGSLAACGSTRLEVALLRQAPDPDADDLVRAWLFRDCDTEGTDELRKRIRAFDADDADHAIERAFLQAADGQPEPAFFQDYEAKALERWGDMLRYLRSGPDLGLPPDLRGLIEPDGFAPYWEEMRAQVILTYRGRALLGLGITRGEAALTKLKQVSMQDGPLALAARHALKTVNR